MPEQWERKPHRIWVAKLTADNALRVATWCGGQLVRDVKASDPTDVAFWVHVPTLDGIAHALAGRDWVVKDDETGQFRVVVSDAVQEDYRKVGVRAGDAIIPGVKANV